MLNHSASLAMSTSFLKALPGKLDTKRHSPSILYISTVEIPSIILYNMGYRGVFNSHTYSYSKLSLCEPIRSISTKHLKLVTITFIMKT